MLAKIKQLSPNACLFLLLVMVIGTGCTRSLPMRFSRQRWEHHSSSTFSVEDGYHGNSNAIRFPRREVPGSRGTPPKPKQATVRHRRLGLRSDSE